jgi:putative membrane protein
MITRYTDLAANERTYLAWMRTSLAMIAFGFLLERFDLLVRYFAKSVIQEKVSAISPMGREAGIILAALDLIIMVISTFRFVITTSAIRSENQEAYGIRSVLVVGAIFMALAVFVLLFITRLIA